MELDAVYDKNVYQSEDKLVYDESNQIDEVINII